MLKYKNVNNINECLISRFNNNEKTILFKNRDRGYAPNLRVVRDIADDVEYVYLHDIDTDWSEGLNSYGIGIVNSALMVGYDENEKKIIKKTGKKSHDGKIIRKALMQKNLDDAYKILLNYNNGIRGHTIVTDNDRYIIIESTSKHYPISRISNSDITVADDTIVRTNHGFFHINAGYISGKNYLSSKLRKEFGEQIISSVSNYKDLPEKIRFQKNNNPQFNPTRMDGDLKTTSQLLMNITDLEFEIHLIKSNISEFKGIIKNVKITEPKIKIYVKYV